MNDARTAQATARSVIARKAFTCEAYRCWYEIQPGEMYARHVAFPLHDANGGTTPWVMRICADCQSPAPMPPRRPRRAITSALGDTTP